MKQLFVNGEKISPASIDQEKKQLMADLKLPQDQAAGNDKVKLILEDRARQNVIDHCLCKQEAVKRKITIDPATIEKQLNDVAEKNGGVEQITLYLKEIGETLDDFRKHIMDRMLVDKLVESIHEGVSEPKERHAKKFYKENKETFTTETTIEVRWFVKHYKSVNERRKALQEAEKVAKLVRSGKSFNTLVKQRSDEPDNNGLVGYVKKGELAPEFDAYVFSAEPGDISDPIDRQGTIYLLRVGEKIEGTEQEFEAIKASIIQQLWEQEKKEALSKVLDKIRSKAKIEEKAEA